MDKGFQKFVEQCCNDEEIRSCKTYKEVHAIIHEALFKAYVGRASTERINAVVDDIVESICLTLNIPQE